MSSAAIFGWAGDWGLPNRHHCRFNRTMPMSRIIWKIDNFYLNVCFSGSTFVPLNVYSLTVDNTLKYSFYFSEKKRLHILYENLSSRRFARNAKPYFPKLIKMSSAAVVISALRVNMGTWLGLF